MRFPSTSRLAITVLLFGACVRPMDQPDAGTDAGAVDAAHDLRDAAGAHDGSANDVGGQDAGETDAHVCASPAECQDGVFCNGYEACAPGAAGADGRGCLAATSPCAGACDETGRACVAPVCDTNCVSNADCTNGVACDGQETCDASGTCQQGTAVTCPSLRYCSEPSGTCGCRIDADCSDPLFCNGAERCVSGTCMAGTPCAGICTEGTFPSCQRSCSTNADCDDGIYCNGVEACNTATIFHVCRAGTAVCPSGQYCTEATHACSAQVDADGDHVPSIATGGTDCDDSDPNRFPTNPEVCDTIAHDEDCDPTTFGNRDADGDGYQDATCCNVDGAGTRVCGNDCNDNMRSTNPNSVEACNHVDDDCDTGIDEMVTVPLYRDRDGDGYGDATCDGLDCAGTPGWTSSAGDCDDTRDAIHLGTAQCDPSGGGVLSCTATGWMLQPCPAGTACRTQPNGTGVCL